MDRLCLLVYGAFFKYILAPIITELQPFIVMINVQSYHPWPLPLSSFYRWRLRAPPIKMQESDRDEAGTDHAEMRIFRIDPYFAPLEGYKIWVDTKNNPS